MSLVTLAFGALVLIGAMWWAYFKHNAAEDRDLYRETAFARRGARDCRSRWDRSRQRAALGPGDGLIVATLVGVSAYRVSRIPVRI